MKHFFCSKHYQDFLIHPTESFIKEIFCMFTPSLSYKNIKEAAFRKLRSAPQSFDYFKLKNLLIKIGFGKITKKNAVESAITNWTSYELDTTSDGLERKADSLYVEAHKGMKY